MKKLNLLLAIMIMAAVAVGQSVGINSDGSAPDASAMLDVSSTSKGFLAPRMTAFQRGSISSPVTGLLVYQTDGETGYYHYNGSSWVNSSSLWSSNLEGGIYYNSGNIGIGTISPVNKLSIAAPTGQCLLHMTVGTEWWQVGQNVGVGGTDNTFGFYSNTYGQGHALAPVMTMTNTGNVGIGTTTPSQKLDVNGIIQSKDGTNSDGNLFLGGQNVSLRSSYVNNVLGIYTTDTERIRINGSGYVGIGTTDPSYPLHVASFRTATNDPGYYFNSLTSSLTYTGSAERTIGIYCAHNILTNNAFVAVSDLRIKENIKEIPHSLDLVRKLRPVSYNKIDKIENGGRTEFGFIAQEVEKILPEAVNTGTGEIPVLKPFDKVEFEAGVNYTILVKNGDDIVEQKYTTKDLRPEGEIIVKSKTVDDFKSLSYDMIFTVAVDAIREQQAQIEAQQAQLASQQAQIDALKAQNAVLTQKAESFDQLKAEVENLKKLFNANLSQLTDNQ